MTEAAKKGYQVSINNKNALIFILNGELANADNIDRTESEVPAVEFEKIMAYLNEDLKIRLIPNIDEEEEIEEKLLENGWQQNGIVYLRLGPFAKRHRLKTKDIVAVFKDRGIQQKSVRLPSTDRTPVKVWVIELKENQEQEEEV